MLKTHVTDISSVGRFFARTGEPVENTSGNFRISVTPNGHVIYPAWMPSALARTLNEFARNSKTGIQAVAFSFDTVIALKIEDVWLQPGIRYSTRTGRHMGALYPLNTRSIPFDASADDIAGVIAGHVTHDQFAGLMRPGWVLRPENAKALGLEF